MEELADMNCYMYSKTGHIGKGIVIRCVVTDVAKVDESSIDEKSYVTEFFDQAVYKVTSIFGLINTGTSLLQ